MGGLAYYLSAYPYLALPQAALTIWMLADAGRRGAEWFWFWVILFFQPIGPWAYFFAVKARDFRDPRGWLQFQRAPSLDELRYQVDTVPTLASHLALAQRLIELGRPAEALPHLEQARAREPDHSQVLYGLAVCHADLGAPGTALPLLERILERDRRWSEYRAFRLLIVLRARTGDTPGALEAARELVRIAPSLEHHCLLAEQLNSTGNAGAAAELLKQALETHRFAPAPARRRDRAWAHRARLLYKEYSRPVRS